MVNVGDDRNVAKVHTSSQALSVPAGGASPREGGGGGGAASKPATSLAKDFTAFKNAFKRKS